MLVNHRQRSDYLLHHSEALLPTLLLPLLFAKWLSVQGLWRNLEAVFSNTNTAQEFPKEAVKFASIHSSWCRLMRAAFETKNLLQVNIITA